MSTDNPSLPYDLAVGKFLESRIKEISGLASVLETPTSTGKLASQQVPKHMRRRAVSHNPKRLPRRLRLRQINQMDKGGGNVQPAKRPSRKFRRRPKNLLLEYNRRQKNTTWLETHIWHAKRFHMEKRFGYSLAHHPNDKCWRACYRATTTKCLMRDISYFSVIQLSGDEGVILEKLALLTNSATCKVFRKGGGGAVEEEAMLFKPGQYPRGAIGEVSYLWKPDEDEDCKILWIWIAGEIYQEALEIIKGVFGVVEENCGGLNTAEEEGQEPKVKKLKLDEEASKLDKSPKNVNLTKLETKNVPYERTPKFQSESGIEITLMKDTLNRFRLTGPLSSLILSHCLKPSNVDVSEVDSPLEDDKDLQWWTDYYSDKKHKEEFNKQSEAWEIIKEKGPGELPKGMVLSLTIRDPRLLLPKKRNQVVETIENKCKDSENVLKEESNDASLMTTPLWSSSVRDSVSLSKCPDYIINKLRGDALVPGTPLHLGVKESRVPVMLIQRPGGVASGRSQWGAGWDIVVPAGWGMSTWMCLVFCGARVGGLNEAEHFELEQGKIPCHEDTSAGKTEMERRGEVLKEAHFKLPPAKRVNFVKEGVASPFTRPWAILLADWINTDVPLNSTPVSPSSLNWHVTRDGKVLSDLNSGKGEVSLSDEALIPVKVKLIGKGMLSANAMICLPSDSDLEMLKQDQSWGGPEEVLQDDHLKKEREETRKKHQSLKKQLKRRWKKVKDKKVLMKTQAAANIEINEEKLKLAENSLMVLKKLRDNENIEYKNKSDKLWIGDFNSVKNSCIRPVMGFIRDGGYSFREGGSVGVGYVAWKAWEDWKMKEVWGDCSQNKDSESKKSKLLVLVKDTSSLQYRFATMDVIIDV